jgi:serine/threonine-protein kinase RsbW
MQPPRDPGSPPVYVVIPSDAAEARRVQDQVEQCLQATACHDHDLFSIKLALEEALVNAIRHGNQYDRAKTVQIAYRLLPDRFEVHITDEGGGFDPSNVPNPTALENLACPGGRGVMLMRRYMTEVCFNERGNAVSMCKLLRNGKK